jgi:hypothetical protein
LEAISKIPATGCRRTQIAAAKFTENRSLVTSAPTVSSPRLLRKNCRGRRKESLLIQSLVTSAPSLDLWDAGRFFYLNFRRSPAAFGGKPDDSFFEECGAPPGRCHNAPPGLGLHGVLRSVGTQRFDTGSRASFAHPFHSQAVTALFPPVTTLHELIQSAKTSAK